MRRRLLGPFLALMTGFLLLLSPSPATATGSHGNNGAWTGTWAAGVSAVPPSSNESFEDRTLRQIVHTSIPGNAVRVHLTNRFGTEPLVIGEAHVARTAAGATTDIVPGSDRTLRFGGHTSVTLAPGADRWSDPVGLSTAANSDLSVSIHLPRHTRATTMHSAATQYTYVAAGNVTGKPSVDPVTTTTSWYFLSGVSVNGKAAAHRSAVVTFGDSITDGSNSTTGANHRWPDLLSARLRSDPALDDTAVLNTGIGGNRLLFDPNPPAGNPAEAFAANFGEAGLKRFDRDALDQPGVRYVAVFLGVNDLGHAGNIAPVEEEVTPADLIAGYEQLIARAHARGVKIFGTTIMPFEGDTLGFYTPEREAKRQAVNTWIRTSGAYDGVIDFDAVTRDPAHPGRLLPAYNSGDGLHPNDAGMTAMANAVPLRLFR